MSFVLLSFWGWGLGLRRGMRVTKADLVFSGWRGFCGEFRAGCGVVYEE